MDLVSDTKRSKKEGSSRRWRFFALVILLFAAVFVSTSPKLGNYDEALVLDGAVRVLHGQVPYRDFYTLYGPAQFFTLAWIFRIFGVYAIFAEFLYVSMTVITLLTTVKLVGLFSANRWVGIAAAGVSLAWLAATQMYFYPVYPALGLIFLAALCCLLHWRTRLKGQICLAGALIGCVVLFRHDLAMYSFLSLLAGECFYHLADRERPFRIRAQELLRDLGLFIGFILVVVVPMVGILLAHVPLSDIQYQLFFLPAHVYGAVRHLPLFYLGRASPQAAHFRYVAMEGVVIVPFLTALSTVTCLLQKQWRERQQDWQVAGYISLTGLVLALPVTGLVRPDFFHLGSTGVISSLVLACLATRYETTGRYVRVLIVGTTVFLLLVTLVPAWRAVRQSLKTTVALALPKRPDSFASTCQPSTGMGRVTCMQVDPGEEQVARYIEQHTGNDEMIYSGVGRHDKILANDLLIYFLSQRDPGTKWYDLNPGVQTTYPIQQQMIQDLDRNHVRYVIRNLTWDQECEPNASCNSSGVTILDQYINANYHTEATFPEVLILRRGTPF
jgi:hypothetical protein